MGTCEFPARLLHTFPIAWWFLAEKSVPQINRAGGEHSKQYTVVINLFPIPCNSCWFIWIRNNSFFDNPKTISFRFSLILLMEEILLTSWGWSFIPFFGGFQNHPNGGWEGDFWLPSTVSHRTNFSTDQPAQRKRPKVPEISGAPSPGNPVNAARTRRLGRDGIQGNQYLEDHPS